MLNYAKTTILILCSAHCTFQASLPEDDSYYAAVVEHELMESPEDYVTSYLHFIERAAAQNADIVVFPELQGRVAPRTTIPIEGLLNTHPIPVSEPALFDTILVTISAAARLHRIYVLVNIGELLVCGQTEEECPGSNGTEYLFNTNVVFDRDGAVIDRYRKINLYMEPLNTPALKPDLGVFETDFGVTFGHIICFDVLFQIPAMQVVQKHNITDIAMPAMWYSFLPHWTAVQMQEAYALGMNINLIAAGVNNVLYGSGGSGIYSGRAGALTSLMFTEPKTQMLVSRVPKVPGQVNFPVPETVNNYNATNDTLTLQLDPLFQTYTTRLIVPGYQEFSMEDGQVTCHFKVNMTVPAQQQFPFYRAYIQDNINEIADRSMGASICALAACQNEEMSSCPFRFKHGESNVILDEVEIEILTRPVIFDEEHQCDSVAYFPSSLRGDVLPLPAESFTFTQNPGQDGRHHLNIKTNHPQDSLVSFGVWGRIYYRDDENASNIVHSSLLLVIISMMAMLNL